MTWQPLGSLALPHEMHSRGVRLRNELQRLSHEVTTGRVASPQRQLRGNLAPLAAIEHRLGRIDSVERSLGLRQTRLDAAQAGLQVFLDQGDAIAAQLRLPVNMPGEDAIADRGARAALDGLTAALNQSVAGQALFAGTKSDGPPLPSGQAILEAAQTAVAGLHNAAEIKAALETFFMDDAGGFLSDIYAGGPPAAGGVAPSGQPQSSLPTAADPAIRRSLMALSMASILGTQAAPADEGERSALALDAATALNDATAAMAALGAKIGFAQADLAQQTTRLQGEQDALVLARETMIGADPYTAATRLEQARGQLESLYMVTARLSRLSLTEFLR